jgi:Helix-turn-helix domain
MRLQARVKFAMCDLVRLKDIQAVVDGDLQPIRAAERLGLTSRQIRRLVQRYRREGPVAMTSRRCSRPSRPPRAVDVKSPVLGAAPQQEIPWRPVA